MRRVCSCSSRVSRDATPTRAKLKCDCRVIPHTRDCWPNNRVRLERQVRLFFTPDLPSDVVLLERQHSAHELPEAYKAREARWRAGIPYRLAATGRFLCSALDETNTRRFLPTYLSKCAPPREMTDPKTIARMIHCITFQQDNHLQVGRPSPFQRLPVDAFCVRRRLH